MRVPRLVVSEHFAAIPARFLMVRCLQPPKAPLADTREHKVRMCKTKEKLSESEIRALHQARGYLLPRRRRFNWDGYDCIPEEPEEKAPPPSQ